MHMMTAPTAIWAIPCLINQREGKKTEEYDKLSWRWTHQALLQITTLMSLIFKKHISPGFSFSQSEDSLQVLMPIRSGIFGKNNSLSVWGCPSFISPTSPFAEAPPLSPSCKGLIHPWVPRGKLGYEGCGPGADHTAESTLPHP